LRVDHLFRGRRYILQLRRHFGLKFLQRHVHLLVGQEPQHFGVRCENRLMRSLQFTDALLRGFRGAEPLNSRMSLLACSAASANCFFSVSIFPVCVSTALKRDSSLQRGHVCSGRTDLPCQQLLTGHHIDCSLQLGA
jgi:hypothetical protein